MKEIKERRSKMHDGLFVSLASLVIPTPEACELKYNLSDLQESEKVVQSSL